MSAAERLGATGGNGPEYTYGAVAENQPVRRRQSEDEMARNYEHAVEAIENGVYYTVTAAVMAESETKEPTMWTRRDVLKSTKF